MVSRGAGYVVAATDPAQWHPVTLVPVVDSRVVLAAGVVVLANHTEMIGYGVGGLKWQTRRLSWDGLKITVTTDRTLAGEYWDIRTEATKTFMVDLETGETRGGVEP